MARQSFLTYLLIIMTGTVVLFQLGCSKQKAESDRASKRIAEIDAQLAHWVPTGRAGDADARTALRTERARLVKQLGLKGPESEIVAQAAPSVTPVPTPVPDPSAFASKIVIAPAEANSVEPMDPDKMRRLNLTSTGGHYDPRTGAVEPNGTPWRDPHKP